MIGAMEKQKFGSAAVCLDRLTYSSESHVCVCIDYIMDSTYSCPGSFEVRRLFVESVQPKHSCNFSFFIYMFGKQPCSFDLGLKSLCYRKAGFTLSYISLSKSSPLPLRMPNLKTTQTLTESTTQVHPQPRFGRQAYHLVPARRAQEPHARAPPHRRGRRLRQPALRGAGTHVRRTGPPRSWLRRRIAKFVFVNFGSIVARYGKS